MGGSIYVRIVGGLMVLIVSFCLTLYLIDRNDPVHSGADSRSASACGASPTILKRPFSVDTGFAFQVPLSQFKELADSGEFPSRSKLVLCENGIPLGPSHSQHADVRTKGMGRYSHWHDLLLFSASDNSSPQTNKREYAVRVLP